MDIALKKGLVKAELRRVWDSEVAARNAYQKNASSSSEESNSQSDHPLHPTMTEEWTLDDSNSPHPNAAQALKEHLHIFTPKL
jgi:hypothetical protein